MNTPTLGEPRFASTQSHTVSDEIRIPERIEIGAAPGLQFELAGPRAKLFFDAKQTRAGIVTCGGLCPGLNNVIRSLFLELNQTFQTDWRSATLSRQVESGLQGHRKCLT